MGIRKGGCDGCYRVVGERIESMGEVYMDCVLLDILSIYIELPIKSHFEISHENSILTLPLFSH